MTVAPAQIDLIRDTALKLEDVDLITAYELMHLAHQLRPQGPFIKQKLDEYQIGLEESAKRKLQSLIDCGDLVIIPAGFRCFTKIQLEEQLGIKQATFPFDNGFFPPISIANVLKKGIINLNSFNLDNANHCACIKLEDFEHDVLGRGIKFITTSYEQIDSLAKSKEQPDINCYLDSTFGYYTLDKENKFILAHYNWHQFSDNSNSSGIQNLETNLKKTNALLNKRISRMFDRCNSAKYILFVVGNFQEYNYMLIDDEKFSLNDYCELPKICHDIWGEQCQVFHFEEVDSAYKILKKLNLHKTLPTRRPDN
ncbi:hypothetical protein NB557_02915 [Vibrio alginolyticus]|nr:hypothetical protein [Vibrio alginolyticus]